MSYENCSQLGTMEALVHHCEALTKAEDAKHFAKLEALRRAAAEQLNAVIRARQYYRQRALARAGLVPEGICPVAHRPSGRTPTILLQPTR